MMPPLLRPLLVMLSVWCLLLRPAAPQEPDPNAAEAGLQQPSSFEGVTLAIRTADDRVRFQQNEIITLELAFTSSRPGAYTISNASYDRSGRLLADRVVVEPPDAVTDPLGDYYDGFGAIGGGISSADALSAEPVVFRLDVNEQWRFETPGRYRLSVRSSRVAPEPSMTGRAPSMLMSNVVEIDIVPSSTVLTSLEVAEAPARVLRFQDTREAALEMARRLLHSPKDGTRAGTEAFEYAFGLLGTPHRRFIVAEMEALVASASGSVNPAFVDTLARLSTLLEYPVERRPTRQDREIVTGRLDAFRRAMDRYTTLAVSAGRRGTPQGHRPK